jgi:hypothetical protein
VSLYVFGHLSEKHSVTVPSDDSMITVAAEKAPYFEALMVMVDRERLTFFIRCFMADSAASALSFEEFIILLRGYAIQPTKMILTRLGVKRLRQP